MRPLLGAYILSCLLKKTAQSSRQTPLVFDFAFPYYQDAPTEFSDGGKLLRISFHIMRQLGQPEIVVGLW